HRVQIVEIASRFGPAVPVERAEVAGFNVRGRADVPTARHAKTGSFVERKVVRAQHDGPGDIVACKILPPRGGVLALQIHELGVDVEPPRAALVVAIRSLEAARTEQVIAFAITRTTGGAFAVVVDRELRRYALPTRH